MVGRAHRYVWWIAATLACVFTCLVGIILGVAAGGGNALQVLHVESQGTTKVVTSTVSGSTIRAAQAGNAGAVTVTRTTTSPVQSSTPPSTVTTTVTAPGTTTTVTETTPPPT